MSGRPAQFKKQVQNGLELALPAYLMVFMRDKLAEVGWELREDLHKSILLSFVKHVGTADIAVNNKVGELCGSYGRDMLKALPNDSPQTAMATVVMFVLKLVDRDLYPDPSETLVVNALLLKEEMETDEGEWRVDMSRANTCAENLIVHATLSNLYLTTGVVKVRKR
jgi:hypothetical protein